MYHFARTALIVAALAVAATAFSQSNQGQNDRDRRHGGNSTHSDDSQTHTRAGHGQTASYHTNSNHFQPTDRVRILRAPQVHPDTSDFRLYAAHHDLAHLYGPDARRGYWGYSRSWTDSSFFFGSYVFDPYVSVGCVSPWYYYPYLPGYVSTTVVVTSFQPIGLETYVGVEYPWFGRHRFRGFDGGYSAGYEEGYAAGAAASSQVANNDVLNSGINDLIAIFQQRDLDALNRVVPQDGTVGIYVDGQFQYGIGADGFYDLLKDNANTSRTVRYDILDVRYNHDGDARVVAAHDFIDPWGQEQTVYHTYLLRVNRRGVQVLEFGTSQTRPR